MGGEAGEPQLLTVVFRSFHGYGYIGSCNRRGKTTAGCVTRYAVIGCGPCLGQQARVQGWAGLGSGDNEMGDYDRVTSPGL